MTYQLTHYEKHIMTKMNLETLICLLTMIISHTFTFENDNDDDDDSVDIDNDNNDGDDNVDNDTDNDDGDDNVDHDNGNNEPRNTNMFPNPNHLSYTHL